MRVPREKVVVGFLEVQECVPGGRVASWGREHCTGGGAVILEPAHRAQAEPHEVGSLLGSYQKGEWGICPGRRVRGTPVPTGTVGLCIWVWLCPSQLT